MAEQTLILGAENHLVATLTPAVQTGSGAPRCVAVLTNSGVIPRSGPHRMNVHLARRFGPRILELINSHPIQEQTHLHPSRFTADLPTSFPS